MTPLAGRSARRVAVVVLVLLAGCAAPAAWGPEELDRLELELRQARADWEARLVQVRVENGSSGELRVRSAALDSPLFAGPAAAVEAVEIAPGAARELSFALPEPRCEPGARTDARVQLELEGPRGARARFERGVPDPNGHLARIHGEDCAAAAVAAGALLRLRSEIETRRTAAGLTALVEIEMVSVPGGPRVELERVDDTVLLKPPREGEDGWPAALDSKAGVLQSLELDLVPSRCDPHAVADDKRGTFFGVRTVVDGVEQPVFFLPPGDELRGRLRAFVGEHCGWGQG